MNEIINQYFDLSLMEEHFGEVFDGFVITLELSIVGGVLALVWGLVLALLRQLPGRGSCRCDSRRSPTSTSSAASRCC